jgi:hypothetical protein
LYSQIDETQSIQQKNNLTCKTSLVTVNSSKESSISEKGEKLSTTENHLFESFMEKAMKDNSSIYQKMQNE